MNDRGENYIYRSDETLRRGGKITEWQYQNLRVVMSGPSDGL